MAVVLINLESTGCLTVLQKNKKMGITILVDTVINAPIDQVWHHWVSPSSIIHWNHATDDWHCPFAENDLEEGGEFKFTMAAKDGSYSFDFQGVYNQITHLQTIKYTIADGRKVHITFKPVQIEGQQATSLTEEFEAETANSIELQEQGWKMILENFKKYVESNL